MSTQVAHQIENGVLLQKVVGAAKKRQVLLNAETILRASSLLALLRQIVATAS